MGVGGGKCNARLARDKKGEEMEIGVSTSRPTERLAEEAGGHVMCQTDKIYGQENKQRKVIIVVTMMYKSGQKGYLDQVAVLFTSGRKIKQRN